MPVKKIVCLGGGSRYFVRALGEFALSPGLTGSEIVLYDLDFEKAEMMAAHGRRMAQLAGNQLHIRACRQLSAAVDGADFALSSIGGSGASMGGVYGSTAHREDIRIAARHGLRQIVGDTGGPAGMMMGLRSLPVYLSFCAEMQKRCPEVVLFNHSNPLAILCRAMVKYGGLKKVVGLCSGIQVGINQLAELLKVKVEDLDVVWIGTNHYHWFTRILLKGKEVSPQVLKKMLKPKYEFEEELGSRLSQIYRHRIVYAEDRHLLEFYPFLDQASNPRQMPYGFGARFGKQFQELISAPLPKAQKESPASRKKQLQAFQADLADTQLPEVNPVLLQEENTARLIENIALGRREVCSVNIPNLGCVSNLPDHAILELEAVTDSHSVRGLQVGQAPLSLMGILQKRIAWQELVVEAGVKGDRNLALQALMLDETVIRPEVAETLLEELLSASKHLLPQFRK